MIDSELSIDPVMSDAMASLGISADKLDAVEETEGQDDNKEVEVKEEESKPEDTDAEAEASEATDQESQEGEEKTEVSNEEPKLTAKEFQEIEAAKAQFEQERKTFQDEKLQVEKELHEKYHAKVKDFDEMDAFLGNLAEKDPELFGLIQQEFKEHSKQYSNPVIDELRNETKSLRDELNSFKNKASDEVTLTKLDSELKEVKSTLGKEAEAAGLKVDWSKVEDAWAKGLSPKQAFYAEYGENLMKASLSKAKVEIATKKVSGTPSVKTAGTMPKNNAPVKMDFSKMGIREVLEWEAKNVKKA